MAERKSDPVTLPAQEPVPAPPAAASPEAAPPPAAAPAAATDTLLELTDLNWEQNVEKNKGPVAVMFYSPTCAFCHQMEPYFRNYARDYRDTIRFARLNIMASPWTAERYGVRSTPTFTFFCAGRPVQEMVGSVYPALLKKMVEDVLAHGRECAKNSTAIDYEITGYG
jgi:thioredoxin-like negative regulator of GroEL